MADDDKNTPPARAADDANAKQAQALLDALGPKLTEAILPAITEKVEEQIKGVVAKNSELTEKLFQAKNKQHDDAMANLTAFLDGTNSPQKPTEVVLSKADARDPRKYHAAKKQAAEAGVELRIDREAS